MQPEKLKIGIIGLGYVGLPLLAAFARHYQVAGFDISSKRILELRDGSDHTGELEADELAAIPPGTFSDNIHDLAGCNVIIVAVPTPIDTQRNPDLGPLEGACRSVGSVLKKGDTVVFESTVYPGATEEVCIPILAAVSGLTAGVDFSFGYSPERINPGDKQHRIEDIVKVTSGCDEATAQFVDALYARVITAGTFKAASIKTAEAAKVIENTQRDVNIALINELAVLFDRLDLDTHKVLEAASTKWNFLPFTPGLVGGHCIGVDPYYLTHKALQVGHHPEVILAGRKTNDAMADFVIAKLGGLMQGKQLPIKGARVLVMGLTFKENCPDTRNSQVFRIVDSLTEQGAEVDVFDPWVLPDDAGRVKLVELLPEGHYDAIVIAVNHREFAELGYAHVRSRGRENCVVFDLKHVFDDALVDARL